MLIKQRGDSYQVTGTFEGARVRKQFKTQAEAVGYVNSASLRPNAVTKGSFKHVYDLTIRSREGWDDEKSKPRANAKLVLDAGSLWSRQVDSLTLDELLTIFEKFKRLGNSGSTINRKKSALSVLYATARGEGYTQKTIGFLKQSGKAEGGRERVYSDSELQAMHEACEHLGFSMLSDMVTVLLYGGLRVGELYMILGRYRKNLDRNTKRLKVVTLKGGLDRTVLLNDIAYDALLRLMARANVYTQRLFNSRWSTMRTYLGMQDDIQYVPHSLRHTCASKLVSKGIQIVKIKEFMGHRNIQTTMKYMHVDAAGLDECSAALTF